MPTLNFNAWRAIWQGGVQLEGEGSNSKGLHKRAFGQEVIISCSGSEKKTYHHDGNLWEGTKTHRPAERNHTG